MHFDFGYLGYDSKKEGQNGENQVSLETLLKVIAFLGL